MVASSSKSPKQSPAMKPKQPAAEETSSAKPKLNFSNEGGVDTAQLFAPHKTAPVPAASAKKGSSKRAREADGDADDEGKDTSDVKAFRAELKEEAKKRKKHLSHLHDKQDPQELKRTIFVGNLPNDITTKDLKKIFTGCGDVESARVRNIVIDKTQDKTGKARGRGVRILRGEIKKSDGVSSSGFVVFKKEASVENALRLSGSVHYDHHIYVSREDNQSKAFNPQNSIYLGNVSYDVSDEEIWQLFIEHGFQDVSKVRVVRDKDTGLGKGFAYVSFRDPNSTNKAIHTCRQAMLHGREVRICHVQRPKDPKFKTLSRREIRKEGEKFAPQAGPLQGKAGKKHNAVAAGDAVIKTSNKRQAAKDSDANPSWMGATTNPRKKMPKDLRVLIPLSIAEKKAIGAKKRANERNAKKAAAKKPAGK